MAGEPLYKSIAKQLINDIESGIYIRGDILPTEAKLCKKYNVSRITVRQALDILTKNDYVKKIQGSGTHVTYFKYNTILHRSESMRSFTDEMKEIGRQPSAKVIKFELIFADKKLALELGLQESSEVFYYERILYGDNHPYCYETGYMPYVLFPDLTIKYLQNSKNKYIEEQRNIKLAYSHQIVNAILSDKKLNQYLDVAVNIPLLNVVHISYDINGIPIEKVCNIFDSRLYNANFLKRK